MTKTRLEHLPTEIFFMIFNYLSINDIIYSFFNCNQRFNNLIYQNLHYIELPTRNFDLWKNILPIIGCQIETLKITSIDLSFPLTYFPNLKSIFISSPTIFPKDQLELILKDELFSKLHSFKMIRTKYYDYSSFDRHYIKDKVFNHKSSLTTFHYVPIMKFTMYSFRGFEINLNLHSLKIHVIHFVHVFTLISYTPNLEYLNAQCESPSLLHSALVKTNIKLKTFYLKFNNYQGASEGSPGTLACNLITNGIQQFSSSLTCFSFDLTDIRIINLNEIPFNGIKLQQLLKPMIELKQFHLYARLHQQENSDKILSTFSDHKWIFAMHGRYLYTLPFHFDYLHNFYGNFDSVKSNNPDILLHNPRIWYNVKQIDLHYPYKYDLHFLKQLKIKMPKLTCIKFYSLSNDIGNQTQDLFSNINEREKACLILNNVTTIQCMGGYLKDTKQWLIHALPNFYHTNLSFTDFSSQDNEFNEILNKKIQQLDICSNSSLEQLIEKHDIYFSNVRYICLDLSDNPSDKLARYADVIKIILKNFKSLQILLIHACDEHDGYDRLPRTYLSNVLEHSDMMEMNEKYQMKQFFGWIQFSKEKI